MKVNSSRSNSQNSQFTENNFILYSYRWIIFVTMGFSCMMNGMIFTMFTTTATKCSHAYSISMTLFSINNFMILIMYPVANLTISDLVHKRFGMRISISTGLFCLMVCAWLRVLINSPLNQYFILITISGIFAGISQPFLMNSYSEIGFNWFSVKERVVVTSVLALLSPIGGAIGLVYPIIMIGEFSNMDDQTFKERYQFALLVFAIFSSVFFIITIIFLRNKPRTPPSKSSEKSEDSQTNSNLNCMVLLKNCNFLIEAVIFSIFYGTMMSNSIVVQMILYQFKMTPVESAKIGVIFTLSGLISAFIVSFLLAKTNLYKLFTIIVALCATLGFAALIIFVYYKLVIIAYVCSFFFGAGIVPILSICYQFGCEIAFPVSVNLVSGFQLSLAQAYAVIITLVITLIIPSESQPPEIIKGIISSSIIIIGMIIGIILSFIVKEELNRLKIDLGKINKEDTFLNTSL